MTANELQSETLAFRHYNHRRYELRRKVLRFLICQIGFRLLAKIDRVEGLENIPPAGPAILMMNHIAFIDSIVVLATASRDVVPLAKVEVYDYPVIGIFPRLWGVIPVRREEVDRRAIHQALDVLRAGEIVLVAPEGTRNTSLQSAREGVAYLASRSGAIVVPVALEGTPGFPAAPFSRRWRGPGATVRFERPFRFRPEYQQARGDQLRLMKDEAMFALAAILPEHRRGVYHDMSQATRHTIEYLGE